MRRRFVRVALEEMRKDVDLSEFAGLRARSSRVQLCARWPDHAQRVANLDALRVLAGDYEKRCGQEREAGTVAGLLAVRVSRGNTKKQWLDELADVAGEPLLDLPIGAGAGYVLIDHKTFPGSTVSAWRSRGKAFLPQMAAYAEAVERLGDVRIAGIWVHFPMGGGMVEVIRGPRPRGAA